MDHFGRFDLAAGVGGRPSVRHGRGGSGAGCGGRGSGGGVDCWGSLIDVLEAIIVLDAGRRANVPCGGRPGRRPAARCVSWVMLRPPAPAGPIQALEALDGTETLLGTLLDTLTVRDWDVPTIVPGWRVRHVAGHLLDTALRRLSLTRDGVAFERPAGDTPEALRTFVDRLNAEGVAVFGRLSPAVLRSLMGPASAALCRWLAQRDPDLPADFPVSWAGDTVSPHWFDVARELTERWHHQQQIRLALDRPGLMVRQLYYPVLDCFMRALPWRFRDVAAQAAGHVAVTVSGDCGGTWRLYHDGTRWQLTMDALPDPLAHVTIDQDIAWRVFTKGIRADDMRRRSTIEGDEALGARVLSTVAIVG